MTAAEYRAYVGSAPAKPPPSDPQPATPPPTPRAAKVPVEAAAAPQKPTSQEAAVLLARSGVRWYASSAADAGLLQVKFAGVPAERLPELIHAAQALFPELRQY